MPHLGGFAAIGMMLFAMSGCGDFKLPKASEIAAEFTGKEDEAKTETKKPAAPETPSPAESAAAVKPAPAQPPVAPETKEPARTTTPEQVLADLEAKEFKVANDVEFQNLVDGLGERASEVTKLDFENSKVSAEKMPLLESFTQLKDLNLTAMSLTSDGWEPLAKLTTLEKLNLERTSIDNAGLANIRGLVHLKDLNLKRTTQVTDEGHYNLERLKELEKLDISSNQTIKGGGFVHCRNAKGLGNLRELIANNTQFGQDGMGGIQHLKSLEVLELGKTGLTNIGMGAFRKCTGIKRLLIGQNAGITDVGMAELAVLKDLEFLELFNLTNVTNIGLSYVKKAKQLQYVNVTGTRINEEGMRALKKLIPNVKIKKDNKVIE
jgi:Leucine-rich repeat (LRR) protein